MCRTLLINCASYAQSEGFHLVVVELLVLCELLSVETMLLNPMVNHLVSKYFFIVLVIFVQRRSI